MSKKIVTPEPILYVQDDTARIMGLTPRDWVTSPYQDKYVFLNSKEQITDVNYLKEEYKRTKRSTEANGVDRPILSLGADGVTPTLLAADIDMEPEEAVDILGQNLENQEAKLRTEKRNVGNKSPVIDTEWIRYVNDLPPSSEFDRFFRQTLQDRIKKHKENPITDPARSPVDEAKAAGLLSNDTLVSVPENYNVSESIDE